MNGLKPRFECHPRENAIFNEVLPGNFYQRILWTMRYIKGLIILVVVLAVGLASYGYLWARKQGRDAVNWSSFSLARVTFDAQGIPTLEAPTWKALIEAEGFVMASDRLWHMELMRRSASGHLSEWFGSEPKAVAWDRRRREEDWMAIADREVHSLPKEERQFCEWFAEGVNRFVEAHPGAWGLEYRLLGEKPLPWKCRDSLLILLSMADDLSAAHEEEAAAAVWHRFLPQPWFRFLFTQDHPWNQPLFSKTNGGPQRVPTQAYLPAQGLAKEETRLLFPMDEVFRGSNTWVYRNDKETLLANDPHLSYSVPQLWYPVRLRRSQDDWVAGTAIPGIPGIVLGRNANVAWGFTNAKEDVDDLLEETLSPDGKKYLASKQSGKAIWRDIEERPYTIQVRGAESVHGVARFTHRGPLSQRKDLADKYFSRQWLAFQPGMLRLPVAALMKARNWQDYNRALDGFPCPAQASVFAQRDGAIGLRVSGRGIRRRNSGLIPRSALEGEWLGFEPVSKRPREFIPAGNKTAFLSTANQRLWVSDFGHHWSSDLRQTRIQKLLSANRPLSREDMKAFQHDTHSRFLLVLLRWVSQNSSPKNEAQRQILSQWKRWDGSAESDPAVFAQALRTRSLFMAALLGRIRRTFIPSAQKEVRYDWRNQNAWFVSLLEGGPIEAFGLEAREVGQWLLNQIEASRTDHKEYAYNNRWRAQHPFAGAIPVLGHFFGVDEHPQAGFEGLVRVERPKSGASTRLIWDLRNPDGGEWGFPVGVSGHPFSKYYRSFRKAWFAKKYFPVWGG